MYFFVSQLVCPCLNVCSLFELNNSFPRLKEIKGLNNGLFTLFCERVVDTHLLFMSTHVFTFKETTSPFCFLPTYMVPLHPDYLANLSSSFVLVLLNYTQFSCLYALVPRTRKPLSLLIFLSSIYYTHARASYHLRFLNGRTMLARTSIRTHIHYIAMSFTRYSTSFKRASIQLLILTQIRSHLIL